MAWFKDLKSQLDEYKFDRVYAWGHPDGLERGQNFEAYDEMIAMIPYAQAIGADVMRVVGSSLMFRHEPHGPQIKALVKMFKKAVKVAKDYNVKLAVENHIDFTSDEILQLLGEVNSPYFGPQLRHGQLPAPAGRSHKGYGEARSLRACNPCKRLDAR